MKKLMIICIGFIFIMCLSFMIPLQARQNISLQCLHETPMHVFTFCEQKHLNCYDNHTSCNNYDYNYCIKETKDYGYHHEERYMQKHHQRHH